MSIASVAQTGFASSSAYDTHRPSYPVEAVERFLEVLEIKDKRGARVLDLGAGTGKFTKLLHDRPEKYDVTAIEPHDGMRKELEAKQMNVNVQKGTAENLDMLSAQTFDAVIVAQAFHWMSSLDTLKQIHRVLKPTAVLGLIWNIEDYNAPKEWDIHEGWESTMRDVMWSEELEDDQPRYRNLQWKKVFDEQGTGNPLLLHLSDPIFGLPVGEDSVEFTRWLSKDDVWSTFQTYSQVANLKEEQLAKVKDTFDKAINSGETEVTAEGKVAVHGKTVFAWTSSIPDDTLRSGG